MQLKETTAEIVVGSTPRFVGAIGQNAPGNVSNRDSCVRAPADTGWLVVGLSALMLHGCALGRTAAVEHDGDAGQLETQEGSVAADEPELQRVDRQPEVPAPDEMVVATIAVVDAAAEGLLEERADGWTLRLHQAPCRIVEAEPDVTFESGDALGCRAYAYEQLPQRTHRALQVPAGALRIEIVNESVGHEVGLWLRRESDGTLVATSGGAGPGAAVSVNVTLSPGRYLYSCPLNPTPAYLLVVQEDSR